MHLVVFDVDGTLVTSAYSDIRAFSRAFVEVVGAELPTLDFDRYPHRSDTGILDEAVRELRGSVMSHEEHTAFEAAFLLALEKDRASFPDDFMEVPGAVAMLEALSVHDDYGIALATGCLRRSALFKLESIGVDLAHCWAGFSEDGPARVDIVRTAIERADCCAEEIIYIGDGPWDVAVCRELEIPFVGITHQSNEEVLRAAGANVILPDFRDLEAFIRALHAARVPG